MSEREWLVVGLGNPGPEYAATRHNIGYLVLDVLVERMTLALGRQKRVMADCASGRLGGAKLTLVRPRTFMNESGGPVKAAASYFNIDVAQIIAIHDDLDLPFGEIRLKFGGGDGGHNGLKSLRKSLGGGDYYRVRVGIGRPPGRQDPADYVLHRFSAAEHLELPTIDDRAADAVELLVAQGLQTAQNKYHSE